VAKPVRQVAQVSWEFAHDYAANNGRDFAMDGSGGKGSRAEQQQEQDEAVFREYFADDADEAAFE
jgi:hypothetical protein